MAVTLAEKQAKMERDRARLEERERELKEQQRRSRTRLLFSAGSLVERVGLLKLETAALYGALLSLENGATDTKTVERWTKAGREAMEREEAEKAKLKEPLSIAFAEPINKLAAAEMRKAGFQFNRVFKRWDGLAVLAEAEALAQAIGGVLKRESVAAEDLPLAAE